eukprot:6019426-Prymnesium_polylepis.4
MALAVVDADSSPALAISLSMLPNSTKLEMGFRAGSNSGAAVSAFESTSCVTHNSLGSPLCGAAAGAAWVGRGLAWETEGHSGEKGGVWHLQRGGSHCEEFTRAVNRALIAHCPEAFELAVCALRASSRPRWAVAHGERRALGVVAHAGAVR